MIKCKELDRGDVGYIVSNIQSVEETKVGDTVTHANKPAPRCCLGYKEVRPMVYCGLYR